MSLENADTKQNIVTGRRQYKRTLKSNNDWTGLGLWTNGDRAAVGHEQTNPEGVETGVSRRVSRGPK